MIKKHFQVELYRLFNLLPYFAVYEMGAHVRGHEPAALKIHDTKISNVRLSQLLNQN